MSTPLGFQIQLTDQFAGKMANVNTKLQQGEKSLMGVKAGLDLVEKSAGSLGSIHLPDMHHFFTFDVEEAARHAIEAVGELVHKFIELGSEIVKTAGKSQDLELAIKLNLGDEGAEQLGKLADSFEATTRLDDDRVKRALLPLTQIGVKDIDLLDNILTAAVDLSTRTAGDISVEQATEAFQKIALKGEVDPKILRALSIGPATYYEKLGATLGKSAASVEKLAKLGKIDKADLIQTGLALIAERQGGALGVGALAGDKTLGATLERLANLKENIFKKIANGPGVKAVQDALETFITNMRGEAGTKLINLVDKLLVKLAIVLTPENIEKFIKGVVAAIEGLAAVAGFIFDVGMKVGAVGVTFMNIGESVGQLGASIFTAVDEFTGAIGTAIQSAFDALELVPDMMADVGRDIWKGLVDGITEGVDAVGEAFSHLGEASIIALKATLGIHSPSAVMAELGSQTAAGFADGIESGQSRVDEAKRKLAGTASSADVSVSSLSGARGGISVSFGDIIVQGPVSAAQADEVVHDLGQKIRVEILKVLDEVAYEQGAAA